MLASLAALVILGFVMVGWGWRGRRVGDHVHCRKCGYDLSGLPVGVTRCSECGADLALPKATRRGVMVKRRWVMAGGVLIWLAAGGLAYSVKDWTPYTPGWALRMELDGPRSGAAFAELKRRMGAGELWTFDVEGIVGRALALQADRGRVWDNRWGELVEMAMAREMLRPEQIEQYLRQIYFIELRTRPRIRRGDDIPVLVAEEVRCGPISFGDWKDAPKASGKLRLQLGAGEVSRDVFAWGFGETTIMFRYDDFRRELLDGPQKMQLSLSYTIGGFSQRTGKIEKEFSLPIEILRDQPSVRLIQDESLRPAIEGALSIDGVYWSKEYGNKDQPLDRLEFGIRCRSTPQTLLFRVTLTDGRREWYAGHVRFRADGSKNIVYEIGAAVPGIQTSTLDVILRPAPDEAAQTVDIDEIWGGEIRIKGLKVPAKGAAR